MADNLTTSSESMVVDISPIIDTKDTTKNLDRNHKEIESKERQTTMTANTSDNNRQYVMMSMTTSPSAGTNLQRLIRNKLKRKKKPIQGQGSVEDTPGSDVKKRKTKIEAQNALNSDSKLAVSCDSRNHAASVNSEILTAPNEKRVVSKPPLPPKPDKIPNVSVIPPPPPRLKRKLEDNALIIQKLNARAEQLRLEITELKAALATERGAVRTLRAQNEAESRKSKTEIKKLQTILDATKKVVKKKTKEECVSINGKEIANNMDFAKSTHEIAALRDANRALEEKIQMVNEAERRKASDIRSLKDSYEIRLTQITKSAKNEISRLLEEIKTKERSIGQLKKEIHSLKGVTNRKDTRIAQHPPEMKKLKEIERTESSADSSNQKCISTTCGGENEFNSMPHEITQRILEAHDDLHIFRNKDPTNSDTDSALSSAPPSISPQPPNSDTETTDIWQSVKNYSKELSILQNDNESLHRENESLKKELELAKQQIEELEKSAIEARNANAKIHQLQERIKYLESQEDELERETHELREQNELLEFRIIELEESNDKWSLRSNLMPDTRDVWTDTERECDDLSLYPDRSDSGITSPHCQHHLEDDRSSELPYDISVLDPISNDELKRRVVAMTKRINCDEDDKLCLSQILSLLNNFDILSQDSAIVADDSVNIDMVKSGQQNTSDYNSGASPVRSFLATDSQSLTSPTGGKQRAGKIVATVLPYSTTLTSSQDSPRKFRSWQSSSLQESGVFEADLADTSTQCTQTEPSDFPCPPTGELCAEIQKLNKFREKIEECVSKAPVPTILSPNLSDQRKIQYYKDRLEVLEKKLIVYESSGDQQAKKLAERLQREVQLEALVKDYEEQIRELETDNSRLEEERCEFEEAENDTRLKLQRLEVDLEILNQRNLELEMSKEAAQTKSQEYRQKCTTLQESVVAYQGRVDNLESKEKDYKNSLNLIKTAMPAILLFNSFIVSGQYHQNDDVSDSDVLRCTCHEEENSAIEARVKLHHLMARERELTQNITELNRAYNETLESADNLWAQMEKDYKDRLEKAKQTECLLKAKVQKLEQRIAADSQSALERLSYLEENEVCYKNRVCKLNKENKELAQKNETLQNDYQRMKTDYIELKNFLEVVAQQNLEREKQKNRKLEEDIKVLNKMLKDGDEAHDTEIQYLRNQVTKSNKELLHIEVTNAELKEEVCTLEARICELIDLHREDQERIRNLSDELRSAAEDRSTTHKRSASEAPNLAEELAPSKRINVDNVTDLTDAAERLTEAIMYTETCDNCTPNNKALTELAKEIKKLADTILHSKNKETTAPAKSYDDPDSKPGPSDAVKSSGMPSETKSALSSHRSAEEVKEPSKMASDLQSLSKLGQDASLKVSSFNVVPFEVAHHENTEEGEDQAEDDEEQEEEQDAQVMHMQLENILPPDFVHDDYPFGKNENLKKKSQVATVAAEVPSQLRKIMFSAERVSNALKMANAKNRLKLKSQETKRFQTTMGAVSEKYNLSLNGSDTETSDSYLRYSSECRPKQKSALSIHGSERSAIDALFAMIETSLPSDDKTEEIENTLRYLYSHDIVFRQNLNLVLRLGLDTVETPAGSVRSFEQISRAMECIRAIEAMYDPISVPAIESLRTVILDKLLHYFMKSPEKLRCVVCVPKDRSK